MNAFNQIFLLIDHGRHQLCGIDIPATHFQKMGVSAVKNLFYQFFIVIDFSHRGNGKGAVMGPDNQRLGLIVRDTANAELPLHLLHILVEFCAER